MRLFFMPLASSGKSCAEWAGPALVRQGSRWLSGEGGVDSRGGAAANRGYLRTYIGGIYVHKEGVFTDVNRGYLCA